MDIKKYAIVVAGGIGSRMGAASPKQFLILNGKPLLYYTLQAFLMAFEDIEIILVLPEEHVGTGQEIIDAYFDHQRITLTVGGRTRFHSVQNGLALVKEDSVVFVHDAVRCLITPLLIRNCFDATLSFGSAVPVIPCKDSVRILTNEGNEMLDRDMVKLVQTPQTFYSKILLPAYQIDFKDKFTDEASVVESFGLKLYLIEGDDENIKITRPADLLIAEQILQHR